MEHHELTNCGVDRLAVIFSKMNDVNLSLPGKQLTVFVTSDKIWVFKWKLKFWKTYIHHHESLQLSQHLQTFLNEIGGDINE